MIDKKNEIRKEFLLIRDKIPITRRAVAERNLLKIADFNFSKILSFSSFKKEINLTKLNQLLASENRLLLPKMVNNTLEIFEVSNLETDLVPSLKFNILEPNPIFCKKFPVNKISCVLVPGLIFDIDNNRIGYGKGYYDNFLRNINSLTIGVGFIEQLFNDILPVHDYDIKLKQLLLF